MEKSIKKTHVENGDKEILYSRAIKAGKRIYYLDVKRNLKDDLFLAVTESKKVQPKDGSQASFEKHKIFLYKEDFDKFMEGMNDVIHYIQQTNSGVTPEVDASKEMDELDVLSAETEVSAIVSDASDEIKLQIDF